MFPAASPGTSQRRLAAAPGSPHPPPLASAAAAVVSTVGCPDSQLLRAVNLPLPRPATARPSPPRVRSSARPVPAAHPLLRASGPRHRASAPTRRQPPAPASGPRLASLAAPTTGHRASPHFAQRLLCQARCSELTVRQLVRTVECSVDKEGHS